jgi:hypothetical protein
MARITSIEKIDKDKNTKQDVVRATYCFFKKEGTKLFQIDTYGSPNRKYSGQPSQTIQFDGEFAKKLVSILMENFGIEIK